MARKGLLLAAVVVVLFVLSIGMSAQGRSGAPAAPATPRTAAPVDLTGYWVAIISEDWRWRMITRRRATSPASR